MKHVDLSILKETRKLTKEESLEVVDNLRKNFVVSESVAFYLVGLTTDMKKHPYGREPKENYFPQIELYSKFNEWVQEFDVFPVSKITLRKKDNELALNASCNHLYKNQSHVSRAWKNVLIDYQMATNDVIQKEFIVDVAVFLGAVAAYRKYVNEKSTSCDQRIREVYKNLLQNFDHKKSNSDWFAIVLEDLLTLCAGAEKEAPIPCDLKEWKVLFSKTKDNAEKEFKEQFLMN